MTTEEILKEQIAALEQLVAIKNEVITELKSIINNRPVTYQYLPYISHQPYYPYQQPWVTYGGAGGAGGVTVGDPNSTSVAVATSSTLTTSKNCFAKETA